MNGLRRPVWRPLAAIAIPYDRRAILVTLAILAVALAVAAATMTSGAYAIDAGGVGRALAGEAEGVDHMIVIGLRLPRVMTALAVGACLAMAGAIFQTLARNPLASPDIIGFTTGSATGALVVILIAGDSAIGAGAGALIGGFATACVVYLFALGRGAVGQALILCGIAISAMLASVNDFLLTRAELERAQVAKTWLFGSLHATGWNAAALACLGLLALAPLALMLAPRLRMMELGDEVAAALGIRLGPTRLALVALAVALTGVAIAGAGPIGFVALAAPQLARRLTGSAGIGLVSSAALGAALVAAADLAGQRMLAPLQIPAGLLTGACGGLYLIWLLGREWRKDGA